MIDIITLKSKLQSIALLEAILSPDWDDRYYSYNAHWDEGEEMASMRDGEGNRWFIWFKDNLAALAVYTTAAGMTEDLEQIIQEFPSEYQSFIKEPAFSIKQSSALWYIEDKTWIKRGLEDGSISDELAILEWTAADYKKWAEGYYEVDLDAALIQQIMDGNYSEEIVFGLNPEADLELLQDDLQEIGIITP